MGSEYEKDDQYIVLYDVNYFDNDGDGWEFFNRKNKALCFIEYNFGITQHKNRLSDYFQLYEIKNIELEFAGTAIREKKS